jgi:hypothetical protein
VALAALASSGLQTDQHAPASATERVKLSASWPVLYHDVKSLKLASDLIVVGTVQGVGPTTLNQGLPFTDYTVRIDRVIFDPGARVHGSTILLHQLGGTVNGQQYEVEDDPLLHTGLRTLLFLHEYSSDHYYVVGGPSGRFHIQDGRVNPVNREGIVFTSSPTEAAFLAQVAQP